MAPLCWDPGEGVGGGVNPSPRDWGIGVSLLVASEPGLYTLEAGRRRIFTSKFIQKWQHNFEHVFFAFYFFCWRKIRLLFGVAGLEH